MTALLAILLVTILGLLVALRRGRKLRKAARTSARHSSDGDAWSEAGRRMPTPVDPNEPSDRDSGEDDHP